MQIFEEWESEIRAYCRATPTVFKTASNARQTDESGKTYLDFFAGAGVLNFGHNNPKMKEALIEYIQNDGVAHSLDMYTTAKRAFIKKFVDTILKPRQMDYRLQFVGPTGTNAVEAALKLARRVTGRENVVAFHHAFHGMTLGSLAATSNAHFRNAAGVPLNNITHMAFGCETLCPGCKLGCGMSSLERMRDIYTDPASGVAKPAAFLVETIQAEGGVRIASQEWLLGVQQLARELGALFIVDDIQVGCGRTGPYFSFESFGLDPDIITLAKGIGGFGTPMAMNLNKPEHDKHWAPGEHTGTFRGQDLSFIAGTVALGYFDDPAFMADTERKGNIIAEALMAIAKKYPVCAVRGRGMMQAIEFPSGELSKAIASACFERGLLAAVCGSRGQVIKLIPPLTIPDDDLHEGLALFAQAVDSQMAEEPAKQEELAS
ncbi:aspartate aminotransferase family protein [Halothiobacillus neapolitanus]|uniref:2,4-diaminobutyrate 4-transaminase n=1 Tax=Halothiobacillus neapolitanus (strain ATCC 23641 / DSM 15147 / CIP 104769 / NCIMB 8539 / c2) TaxID=555778 RepID=D0KWB3_HALNC|nr:aspartate aminotransferase family protein [Halothiobacillus neapolitanus]ACX97016.1 2,4-diaminobutyrate 4-transaminase [Halothiobacillus neapolitanus c2]TDN59766.1 diaminobutyrate aminotransferase [Halothiobacillus neapolitanus]